MKHLSSTSWLLSALVLLCGCGAGGGTSSPLSANPPPGNPSSGPTQQNLNVAGNWQFTTTSSAGMPSATIAGGISQSGVSVNGAMHVNTTSCFDPLTTVGLSGTLAGSQITLTSIPVNGQVTTYTGSFTSNAFSGTYSINGGCGNGDHGTVTGVRILVMGNTLSGTLTGSAGTFDLSADVTQSGTPSSKGSFGLTGTTTFTKSCFISGTMMSGTFPAGSFILGTSVTLNIATGNGTLTFLGTLDQNKGEISGNYTVVGGSCDQTGTGVLVVSSPWDY